MIAKRPPPHRLPQVAAPTPTLPPGGSARSRGPEFSLAVALLSPAFTPRRSDTAALIEVLLRDEAPAAAVAQALLRIGPSAFTDLLARLQRDDVQGTARATLVRLLGRLTRADQPGELLALLALTRDADPPAARNAIAALSRLPLPAELLAEHHIETALLGLWDERPRPEDRRAIAEALGKLGGPAALGVLRTALNAGIAEPLLQQVVARAVLRLERTALRPATADAPPPITAAVALPRALDFTLLCRAGLTPIVVEELRARGLTAPHQPLTITESEHIGEPGRVTLRSARPLGELLAMRTCSELAISLGGPTHPQDRPPASSPEAQADALVEQVTAALTHERTVQALQTLSRGPLRYRVHFTDLGHRRALVWRIAAAVASRCPALVNDPKHSPWELRISGGLAAAPDAPPAPLRIELLPRQVADPRFAYRLGDVPAASHPTLAAALARLCAARAGDVVWDPFVGSGSELIEVALLAKGPRGGPALFGSDLAVDALSTAAQNAAAAGVTVQLQLSDALGPPPPGLTRIVTNPPMGRRVRRGEVTELLAHFAAHAAKVLPTGGQLAWIAPQPQRTSPILQAGGLTLERAHTIDMNGFWARLELWVKYA